MAFVKLLKIDVDGVPVEMLQGADEIIMGSFSVSGGPVMGASGIGMANLPVSNISNLNFNNPATGTINQTAGVMTIDNIMGKDRDNIMSVSGSVLFPVVTNTAAQVDLFRFPAVAGIPTATPLQGGSGYAVYDSVNGVLNLWDGTAWQGIDPNASEQVTNLYTAGEAIARGDLVYISAANTVMRASAAAAASTSNVPRAIGVARAAIANGAQGYIQSEGVAAGFTGLTPGQFYFLSTTVLGGVQSTAPVASQQTLVKIGQAKSATEMHLNIEYMTRRS